MKKKIYELEDIIHDISYHSKDRVDIFRNLSVHRQGEVILSLSKNLQHDIVSKLEDDELIRVLEHLDTDEATDILRLLPKNKGSDIVNKLNSQLKEDVSLLLKFDPETAAGLMDIDYIQVKSDETVLSISKQVEIHEKRTGKIPAILVMKNGKMVGYMPIYKLGIGKPTEKALKYTKKIKSVKHNTKTKEVLDLFRNHSKGKVVVLGDTGNVMGIIYSSDVLRILRERKASSLYDFAGVSQEESVLDSTGRKIGYRYKWLMINLGTAFLASFVVGFFDEIISKYVLLAVYMPIVAGMGGNAGTQTLAVMVRGISLKQVSFKTVWRTLKNEIGSGFVNGLINGLIVTAIVFFKDGDLRIGIILALAMISNLLIASSFGTVVPLIMKKLGKDPASSATIFITTATDIFGFMVFLGLATLILS